MNNLSIEILKKNHAVKVFHYRRVACLVSPTKIVYSYIPQHICFNPIFGMNNKVSQTGGKTEVFVKFNNGTEISGVANCSKHDNFRKKTGIFVALKRIKEELARQTESLKNV